MNEYSGFHEIAQFQLILGEKGLESEDVSSDGFVEVPNPPYAGDEHFVPFVQQLTEALLNAGFARTGPVTFESPSLRAMIRHIDDDRQTGNEIDVSFSIRDAYMDGIMAPLEEEEPETLRFDR